MNIQILPNTILFTILFFIFLNLSLGEKRSFVNFFFWTELSDAKDESLGKNCVLTV